jgi:hypothetical protein
MVQYLAQLRYIITLRIEAARIKTLGVEATHIRDAHFPYTCLQALGAAASVVAQHLAYRTLTSHERHISVQMTRGGLSKVTSSISSDSVMNPQPKELLRKLKG